MRCYGTFDDGGFGGERGEVRGGVRAGLDVNGAQPNPDVRDTC